MKKTFCFALLIVSSICFILLSGCSDSSEVNLPNQKEKINEEIYEGTIDIGSIFYTNGMFDYVYGGIVNDSIVINVYHDKAEVETTLLFYIPITRTDSLELPYDDKTTIRLKKADKIKGTAEISLTTITNGDK